MTVVPSTVWFTTWAWCILRAESKEIPVTTATTPTMTTTMIAPPCRYDDRRKDIWKSFTTVSIELEKCTGNIFNLCLRLVTAPSQSALNFLCDLLACELQPQWEAKKTKTACSRWRENGEMFTLLLLFVLVFGILLYACTKMWASIYFIIACFVNSYPVRVACWLIFAHANFRSSCNK